jgi:hypothetical protein
MSPFRRAGNPFAATQIDETTTAVAADPNHGVE